MERPLAPPDQDGQEIHSDHGPLAGLLWGALRVFLAAAGGGGMRRLLGPLWAAHWRAREYAADAHAAALGQAEDLARHLSDHELALDLPHQRLVFDLNDHPPVASRLERLVGAAEARGSL